jgi:hypothetical protein
MSVVTSFESLFYLTIIGCHFPALLQLAYGWASQGATVLLQASRQEVPKYKTA